MSREIKFRVWDKSRKEMVSDIRLSGLLNKKLECENLEFLQCTGLNDKNGNPIFEGDILDGKWFGYIYHCDCCKQFTLNINSHGCAQCSGDVHWYEIVSDELDLDVIGNIYENKELLSD